MPLQVRLPVGERRLGRAAGRPPSGTSARCTLSAARGELRGVEVAPPSRSRGVELLRARRSVVLWSVAFGSRSATLSSDASASCFSMREDASRPRPARPAAARPGRARTRSPRGRGTSRAPPRSAARSSGSSRGPAGRGREAKTSAMTCVGSWLSERGGRGRRARGSPSSWKRPIMLLDAGRCPSARRSRRAAARAGSTPSASTRASSMQARVVVADQLLDAALRPARAAPTTSSRIAFSWSLALSPAAQRRLQRDHRRRDRVLRRARRRWRTRRSRCRARRCGRCRRARCPSAPSGPQAGDGAEGHQHGSGQESHDERAARLRIRHFGLKPAGSATSAAAASFVTLQQLVRRREQHACADRPGRRRPS